MKVLQVIDQLNVGGAERVLVDLANILCSKGLEVHVLTLVRPGPLADQLSEEIKLINLERRRKLSVIKLWRVNRICQRYDVVHAHLRYNFRYLAFARLLLGGKYSLILHDHSGAVDRVPFLLAFFARRNRWFIGVSRRQVEWAITRLGVQSSDSLCLSNIVIRHCRQKAVVRSRIHRLRILHVSNFREVKNHAFAIALISDLRQYLDLEVCFVGQVVEEEVFRAITDRINQSGIGNMVTMLHNCTDVQALMQDFDIGLHTSYRESGPLAIAEYLAQKLPFVSYKTGEISCQVYSKLPEFFLESFDMQAWIERILEIVSRREDFMGRMDGVFESLFSPNQYFESCVEFYRRIGQKSK